MIQLPGTHDPGASRDAPGDDSERDLWAAVLQQAVQDAYRRGAKPKNTDQGTVTVTEQLDARLFLADLRRLGPICEVLGIDPEWFQDELRKQRG